MRNESWQYKALSHLHINGKEGRHVDTASREFRLRRRPEERGNLQALSSRMYCYRRSHCKEGRGRTSWVVQEN